MPDHGLLFTGDMVLRLLDGTKTTTLRPITPHNSLVNGTGRRQFPERQDWFRAYADAGPSPAGNPGPYLHVPREEAGEEIVDRIYPRYAVGDTIWCKETWRQISMTYTTRKDESFVVFDFKVCGSKSVRVPGRYDTATSRNDGRPAWRPSIHMPRLASRWSGRLVSVEPVRNFDLTYEQSKADGFKTNAECLIRLNETYGRWPTFPWMWLLRWA